MKKNVLILFLLVLCTLTACVQEVPEITVATNKYYQAPRKVHRHQGPRKIRSYTTSERFILAVTDSMGEVYHINVSKSLYDSTYIGDTILKVDNYHYTRK